MNKYLYCILLLLFTVSHGVAVETAEAGCPVAEPNVETARMWWPEQRNIWTPFGWKDHYFRFVSLYNGAIIADPCPTGMIAPRPNSREWVGQDFLLSFSVDGDGKPYPLPASSTSSWKEDGGVGIQGWDETHETPILWTEYRSQQGVVVRQETFAHVLGASDVKSALEPLYAWIRLKVSYVDDSRSAGSVPVAVRLSKNYYLHAEHFEYAVAIDIDPTCASYPDTLHSDSYTSGANSGMRILNQKGKVRLSVLPSKPGKVEFVDLNDGTYALKIDLKAEVGDYVDLLLPLLPADATETVMEERVGFDVALTQADAYWSVKPVTAARFHVPEEHVNRVIEQSLKFVPVLAELDHKTKEYSLLTGAWGYDALWPTPTSMVSHMFLDPLGYFGYVEKYSEIFLKNQGSIRPPGEDYSMHSGYYSAPKTLTSIDWLSDHGAILQQICTHALLSGDTKFTERWMRSIILACEFIRDMSAHTNHNGIKGLLPPGVATDDGMPMQAVWTIAWNYKGLDTAVRLLQREHHPRAGEFAKLLADTKKIFVDAYREVAENGLRWTDDSGKKRYMPPTNMSNRRLSYHIFSDAFYLDTGPMVLVWAGLMEPDDPIMQDALDFFREGPNKKLWPAVYSAIGRSWLNHEISTCEPCYSWNIFYYWKSGDRLRYLDGMYSLFMGALSQNTYISCEHRHGIQGNLFATPLAFYLARLAVIDDQIVPGELHLMRMSPSAWICSKEGSIFERMPTEFGPVDLSFRTSDDGMTLHIDFRGTWRNKPNRVVLHIPPVANLKSLVVNGKHMHMKSQIVLHI